MTDHPDTLAQAQWWWALVWPVLSAIINAAFRAKTPDEWASVCEQSPRFAGLIRLCRAIGLDVHKAFEALAQIAGKS